MAALLAERGVDMLDAPLGRTPIQAEEGKLNMMVGGEAPVFARVRPLFETMAENIFHVGPLGSGHKLKLINNVVAMTLASIVSEAASTAARVGVDLEKMRDVMAAGPLNSGMFNFIMKMAIDNDPSSLQFTVANARKDVGYFTAMAEANGIPTFIAPATRQALSLAVADGHGGDLVPQLYEYFKSKNF
jgi:3-hydroxyisobutyrate dehydrogenase-like beta-hydroxyacid dehydrogenase